jgi:hypothetical protein
MEGEGRKNITPVHGGNFSEKKTVSSHAMAFRICQDRSVFVSEALCPSSRVVSSIHIRSFRFQKKEGND